MEQMELEEKSERSFPFFPFPFPPSSLLGGRGNVDRVENSGEAFIPFGFGWNREENAGKDNYLSFFSFFPSLFPLPFSPASWRLPCRR